MDEDRVACRGEEASWVPSVPGPDLVVVWGAGPLFAATGFLAIRGVLLGTMGFPWLTSLVGLQAVAPLFGPPWVRSGRWLQARVPSWVGTGELEGLGFLGILLAGWELHLAALAFTGEQMPGALGIILLALAAAIAGVAEAARVLLLPPGVSTEAREAPPAVAEDVRYLLAPARGACQYCGDPFGHAGAVRCGACETPHHDDCWSEGGCTTFGCRGRALRVAS